MRPTQILQVLRSIRWRYAKHHAADGRRPEAESLIKKHYDDRNLEARGVEHAEVKYAQFSMQNYILCLRMYRSTFHRGDGNSKEHITVEFQDANKNHVTTHHVYGPNDAK